MLTLSTNQEPWPLFGSEPTAQSHFSLLPLGTESQGLESELSPYKMGRPLENMLHHQQSSL